MRFIEITDGRLLPERRIRSIGPENHKTSERRIYLEDSQEDIQAYDYQIERFARQVRQVLPTAPGTYCISSGFEEGESEPYIVKINILGWLIDDYGTLPITVDGINDGTDDTHAILHPDGTIDVPGERHCENMDEYVVYLKAQKVHLAELMAKREAAKSTPNPNP